MNNSKLSKLSQVSKKKIKKSSLYSSGSLSSKDSVELDQLAGELIFNRYIIIKFISYGTFSNVYLAFDTHNISFVVIKIQEPKYYSDALEEFTYMKKICTSNHPNIVQLLDSFTIEINSRKQFCFVLELLGPDLHTVLNQYERLSLPQTKSIIKQLVTAMSFLSHSNVIHTDLKPENIMFSKPTSEIQTICDWFMNTFNPQERIDEIKKDFPPDFDSRSLNAQRKFRKNLKLKAPKRFADSIKSQLSQFIYSREFIDDSDSDSDYDSDNECDNEFDNFRDSSDNKLDTHPDNESDGESDTHSESDSGSDSGSDSETYSETESIKHKYNIDENFTIKLVDFGLCINSDTIPYRVQTRHYRSPEVILEDESANEKIDIWSVGCITYEILTGLCLIDIETMGETHSADLLHMSKIFSIIGKMPLDLATNCELSEDFFDNRGRVKKHKKIDYLDLNEELYRYSDLSPEDSISTTTFIKDCCNYYIKQRPSADQLLLHPWLN